MLCSLVVLLTPALSLPEFHFSSGHQSANEKRNPAFEKLTDNSGIWVFMKSVLKCIHVQRRTLSCYYNISTLQNLRHALFHIWPQYWTMHLNSLLIQKYVMLELDKCYINEIIITATTVIIIMCLFQISTATSMRQNTPAACLSDCYGE